MTNRSHPRTAVEAANPFSNAPRRADAVTGSAMAAIESDRAQREVEMAMAMARRFPRDEEQATAKILNACTRPTLATSACYAYPRGTETVTGPSIRLAEAIAQAWGNLHFGIVELAQGRGESSILAYAWDLESNTKSEKIFTVPHVRHTKSGGYALKDPRDIYEMVANQGARRLRACILAIVPGDVVEAAVRQCEVTAAGEIGDVRDAIPKLVDAYGKLGVSRSMLERRLHHHLEATTQPEILQLRHIYQTLRDGAGTVEQFFEPDPPTEEKAPRAIPAAPAGGGGGDDGGDGQDDDPRPTVKEITAALEAAPSTAALVEAQSMIEEVTDSKAKVRLHKLAAARYRALTNAEMAGAPPDEPHAGTDTAEGSDGE